MASLARPLRLLSCLTVWACGADAGDGDGSSPLTEARPIERPEPDENGVRVRGGEPNEFGNDGIASCIETQRPVSTDEARELALSIDTHLAWFASTHESSLHYGPPSCGTGGQPSSDTQIAIQIRPLQAYVVSHETNPLSDSDCSSKPDFDRSSDYLTYDAVVTVETADGALAGTFYAPVSEREGGLDFAVAADIRNFEGTLQLPLDPDRVHYAQLGIAATVGAEEMTGSLQPYVTYVDVEPWIGAPGGFAFFPARGGVADTPYCWTDTTREPPTGTELFTLDAYPGSQPPATFPLRLEVQAYDGASADVEVIVAGEPRQLAGVSESEELELGSVELGTELAVSVRNGAGSGRVSVLIRSNDCVVAAASCSGTECSGYQTSLDPVDCR
jgi:hypothetical protein